MRRDDIDPTGLPQLIPRVDPHHAQGFIRDHVALPNLLRRPEPLPAGPDRSFDSNRALWEAVLEERLRANVAVSLRGFRLFEWFPRSPGLFYTQPAEEARLLAMDFLLKDRSSEIPAGIDDAEKLRREEDAYAHPESDDYLLIFDPHGKMSMLEGGVGCVRLRDQVVEGERVWFMSASSTASAHEGFPVAVPDSLYHSCIDQIATQGVLGCSLVGHLRFVPEPLDPVFDRYVDVPQLYLRVDSLEPAGVAADEEPRVSVAVSFLSDWEGSRAYYASYVTFYPGIQGSLKKRAEWLDEVYVSGMYQGTIVTDFDEQMSRFSDAAFSLDKLMSGKLDESQALDAAQPIRLEGQVQLVVQNVREIHAERLSQVTHKTINIGDGNTINAPIVVAEHVENSFNALAESSVDEGLQAALKELLEGAVALAESGAASDTAEMVARDADSLTREVTGSSPREGTARRILSDLRDTVQAVGEIGQPLLATITKLGPLIAGLFA